MAQPRRKQIIFDDYKTIKDEIVSVMEERYENILTKRLSEFEEKITGKSDKQFEGVDKRIDSLRTEMRWLIGLLFVFLSLLMTVYKFIN